VTTGNDERILRSISSNKDVEANAERESGERILEKILKQKAGFVRLGKFGPVAQIGEADDEEKNLPV
jgi:hypothetical protein